VPDATDFDDAFLSQVRLGIVAALLARAEATFGELKALLDLTQGNLGAHLQKLEAAGYVAVEKGFVDRRPRTTCRLTRAGRTAFLAHVRRLEALATDAGSPRTAERRGRHRAAH
jgi:DNA-binding MarR family transcriptional regulator